VNTTTFTSLNAVPVQARVRPGGITQLSLGAYDPNDPGGNVSTSLPPGRIIPANPTKGWFRGDFGGITTPSTPPWVDGANSTPANMWMSFFLPKYARQWQDYFLTANCYRSYSHFHLDWYTARAIGMSATAFVQLLAYVQSWGFYTSFWGVSSLDGNFSSWAQVQPFLQPLLDALKAAGTSVSEKCILLPCKEANGCTSPAGLLDIITNLMPQCAAMNIDVYHHFTSNYPAWPIGAQTDDQFWQQHLAHGVLGCCWQSNASDPAGTMMAHMWDTTDKVCAMGGKLVAFEMCANAQLFGQRSELDGCRLGLEAVYALGQWGVSGAANGLRNIDGSPV
jgi:hypothetical protein